MKKLTFTGGHIFNLRLFFEGVKRLRVTTMAVGILAVVASALVPIIDFLESPPYIQTVQIIPYQVICIPAAVVMFAAPIFFFVLFSFLQKRKQSDFFHAIPYTRTCVYISFVAAALASVFAIQIFSAAVAGVLWSFVPKTTFDVGRYILMILADMLGAAMLSAFMMLALSVSGTGGSCTFLFFLFASLVRIICAIFISVLSKIQVLNTDYWTDMSPLSPLWFYPLSVFSSTLDNNDYFISNPATVIYSIVVTVLLYILAGFLFKRRPSEMAGNPAPGARTQTLFRVLFTLPLALVTTTAFIINENYLPDSLALVLIVCTLLCYFLYELLTTKRAINMLKAIPSLGFVLLACILLSIGAVGVDVYMNRETIEAENIESVTVPSRMLISNYERNQTYTMSDHEIHEIVSKAYTLTKEGTPGRNGRFYEISMKLTSGRTIHRYVKFSDEETKAMVTRAFSGDLDFFSYFQIPKPEDVSELTLTTVIGDRGYNEKIHDLDSVRILATLESEISQLPKEKLSEVFITDANSNSQQTILKQYGFVLQIYSVKSVGHLICHINEHTPKTRALLLDAFVDDRQSHLWIDTDLPTETASDILQASMTILASNSSTQTPELTLFAQPLNLSDGKMIQCSDTQITGEQLTRVLRFLSKQQVLLADPYTSIEVPTAESKIWYLHATYSFDTSDGADANINMAIALTDDQAEELRALLP